MKRIGGMLSAGAVLMLACSHAAPTTTPHVDHEGGAAAARLPWEAALTKGSRFELVPGSPGEIATLIATVSSIDDHGNTRVYHLAWSEGDGPSTITVTDGEVTINDAKLAKMQDPTENGDVTCYAEDLSNPDGCDDVCDAQLCLSPTGIVSVDGLYAPNDEEFERR